MVHDKKHSERLDKVSERAYGGDKLRCRWWQTLASISAILLAAVTSTITLAAPDTNATTKLSVQKRVIDFRSKVSLGGISLAGIESPDGYHSDKAQLTMTPRKDSCPASGKQTIEVSFNQYVCFEPNRRLFDNPKLLGQIDPGIDALFIQCSSVDDSDAGRADRALQYVNLLKGLKELYVDRSDTSDTAILAMPIVSSLHLFSAFLVPLDGSCLKRLAQQPNIRCLMLWDTKMDPANYKYLPDFHKLLYLNLDDDWIGHQALSYVGKCTTLKELSLRWNRKIVDDDLACLSSLKNLEALDLYATKITDKAIPLLRRITHLRELKLGETDVTAEGIEALRPLHLKRLTLPNHNYSAAQRKKVEQISDEVVWARPPDHAQPLDKDTEKIFAPISKHRNL
jgi:hypothetical protein